MCAAAAEAGAGAGGGDAAGAVAAITWAGAYAAEFGLRADYSH